MKKALVLICALLLTLCSCHRSVGGALLERAGMEFTSQIEMIEACLAIDLGDLTDDSIKRLHEETSPERVGYSILYIDLEGAGDVINAQLAVSEYRYPLPLDDQISTLLTEYKVGDAYDFSGITEGYCVISGIDSYGASEIDFDVNHFDTWDIYEIGIWDSSDETLYFVSITAG